MKELNGIEKKMILGLVSAVKTMNISAALYDQNKKAGAWLILAAEIQKGLNLLEIIGGKNDTIKEFIKSQVEDIPIKRDAAKDYMG